MSAILNANIIKTMRENGLLRTDGFNLAEGFVGDYSVKKVVPFKSTRSKALSDDNFRVECENGAIKANLSGFQIVNARVFPKADLGVQSTLGNGIYYREELKDVMNSSVPFNSKFEGDTNFVFPSSLKVIGAMVEKNEKSKSPSIPLRRYKNYSACLKHHRALVNDPESFMTRDEFAAYLSATGDARPAGIPANDTELTLAGTAKETDMANWSFTLLLAD